MSKLGVVSIAAIAVLSILSGVTAEGGTASSFSHASGAEARIRGWVRDLGADDQATCARAAASLGTLGEEAASAVPALVSVLVRERGVVLGDAVVPARPVAVAAVIEALGRIGAVAAPALVAAARETTDDGTRDLLALAIVRIGPAAGPALAEMQGSGSSDERLWAGGARGQIDASSAAIALARRSSSR